MYRGKGLVHMSKEKKKNTFRKNAIARNRNTKTVRKIVSIVIILLIAIFVCVGFFGYQYIKSALGPVDPESEENISVSIPLGSSTSSIGKILEEEDIIKDARVFRFYTKFKNESDFQAGDYTFSQSLTLDEIIGQLKSGKVEADAVYTVTIPEGKNIDQIADIYAHKLPLEKEEFLEKVNDEAYIEQLIEQYPTLLSEDILDEEIRTPLEGYLFAATYSFYEKQPSIEMVVEEMLDKTAAVVDQYRPGIEDKSLSIHEAVTFASLLENEARTAEQREKIAGVFYNRIEEDMMLQTDPTVLYALGEHKDRVLYEDLEIESPYNTYVNKDLPIGPISNFSENALAATVEPEESDYLYFLHDGEGNIHYAETYEEHQKLKDQYITD